MVQTLWDSITEFLSPEAGQRRRAALDEFGRDVEYYVPPELRGLLGFAADMTPSATIDRAAQAGGEMMAPGRTPMERVGSAGRMLSETAGVVAPMMVAPRAGMTAAQAVQEGLLGASVAGQGAADAGRRFLADEAGSVGRASRDLPTPRNDAEVTARDILEMRAAGRAGDVTDEMMAQADPQYMFANTPLPMDEASRMARAREMGRRDEFHGTTTGSDMIQADAFRGSGTRQGIGFVTSDSPYVASSYADPSFGSVFPMLNAPLPPNAPRLNAGGSVWSDLSVDTPVSIGDQTVTARQLSAEPADIGGVLSTNQLSRGASFDYPGIEFSNIVDRSIHAPRPPTDDGMDILREFQRLASDPSTVTMRQDTRGMRSRFARFDPEFRHLRNLSAGVAGGGLLAAQDEQQQREDEIRQYLGGLL